MNGFSVLSLGKKVPKKNPSLLRSRKICDTSFRASFRTFFTSPISDSGTKPHFVAKFKDENNFPLFAELLVFREVQKGENSFRQQAGATQAPHP